MNNPYTSRGPLHDARMFYGRENELNEIAAFLRGNQSVSIVGPRSIGSTSLVLHLMRSETKAAIGLGGEYLLVYLNCRSLTSLRQNEILIQFLSLIASSLHAQDLEPEPALEVVVSEPTWITFNAALRKLDQRGLRVVIILDEFDQLTMNQYIDGNFYNGLRSVSGRIRLVFLTCSERPLIDLTFSNHSKQVLSSPFFNIFAQLWLSLFSRTEAGNLIREPMETAGISVSSQLEDFIFELVGGHPLALQIACYHAWENPDDLNKVEQQTKQEIEEYYQYFWENLRPAEKELLCNPIGENLQEANNPALHTILRDLTRKCLLVKKDSTYTYPSKILTHFVSARR